MIDLLRAMVLVMVAWLGAFAVLAGLGLLIRNAFGLKLTRLDELPASFWMGWALSIVFLQIWHLQFKIDWRAFAILTAVGLPGLLWNLRGRWRSIPTAFLRRWPVTLILCVFAIWLADKAIGTPRFGGDAGLYHFPTIHWLKSYPIVPGLGLLHGRLAFNQSYFLYMSALDFGPWADRSTHITTSLLVMVLFVQVILTISWVLRNKSNWQSHHLFTMLLLGPIMMMAQNAALPSPNVTFIVMLLGLVLAARFLAFLELPDHTSLQADHDLFFIALFSAVAVTVKLNFAAWALATLAVAYGVWVIRRNKKRITALTGALILAGAAALIPWMIRGVILSGYIAYPSSIGAFDVEWRVPDERVKAEADSIRGWARDNANYVEAAAGWGWFKGWAENTSRQDGFMIACGLLGAGAVLALYRKPRSWNIKFAFLLPIILSLIFWFFTAPGYGFAAGNIWALAFGVLVLALDAYGKSEGIVVGLLALALGLSLMTPIDIANLIGPGEDQGFHPIPVYDVTPFETDSGLVIYTPTVRDECWYVALPCTPYPDDPDLRLREPGDIRHGFMLSHTQQ